MPDHHSNSLGKHGTSYPLHHSSSVAFLECLTSWPSNTTEKSISPDEQVKYQNSVEFGFCILTRMDTASRAPTVILVNFSGGIYIFLIWALQTTILNFFLKQKVLVKHGDEVFSFEICPHNFQILRKSREVWETPTSRNLVPHRLYVRCHCFSDHHSFSASIQLHVFVPIFLSNHCPVFQAFPEFPWRVIMTAFYEEPNYKRCLLL